VIRSLPYGDLARFVYAWTPYTGMRDLPRELGPEFPDYFDWLRLSHSFSSFALYREGFQNLGSDEASRASAWPASPPACSKPWK